MKGRTIPELVHDLRSPLSVIQLTAEGALVDPALPGEVREALESILHQTARATEIAQKIATEASIKGS